MTFDLSSLSSAERLLWFYGCRQPGHIDLEGIACDKGAQVIYRCMDGCAARLLSDGHQAVISVQATDNEGRRRFSLGHELAHWLNDARRGFSCSGDDIGPQNAEAVSVEAAANVFASQLILPDYMVTPWLQGRRMSLSLALELSNAFRASVTASAIKLTKKAEGEVCLVCHSMHGRRWFVRSKKWPFGFYPRTQLHQDTTAFELVFKGATGMSRPKVSPGSHWLSGDEFPVMDVEAQSMPLPDGTVLSMLTMADAARATRSRRS